MQIHKKPQITIHIGAAHDEVNVDGHRFDRSRMDRREKNKLRHIVRGVFENLNQAGTWGRQAARAA